MGEKRWIGGALGFVLCKEVWYARVSQCNGVLINVCEHRGRALGWQGCSQSGWPSLFAGGSAWPVGSHDRVRDGDFGPFDSGCSSQKGRCSQVGETMKNNCVFGVISLFSLLFALQVGEVDNLSSEGWDRARKGIRQLASIDRGWIHDHLLFAVEVRHTQSRRVWLTALHNAR